MRFELTLNGFWDHCLFRWATGLSGWPNKIRTCISVFVAQYSHPLNYKSSSVDSVPPEAEEPCSSVAQTDTLPISWSQHLLLSLDSNQNHQCQRLICWTVTLLNIVCGSYENRTHSNRSTICDVSHYTNEPLASRAGSEMLEPGLKDYLIMDRIYFLKIFLIL